jgi:carbon-monoxide dehydrogenase small subunit
MVNGQGPRPSSRRRGELEIAARLLFGFGDQPSLPTRVELSIGYSLRGVLVQVAREGLVRDLAARLTTDFARNLDRHLAGARPDGSAAGAQNLNALSLLLGLCERKRRRPFDMSWVDSDGTPWYDSC